MCPKTGVLARDGTAPAHDDGRDAGRRGCDSQQGEPVRLGRGGVGRRSFSQCSRVRDSPTAEDAIEDSLDALCGAGTLEGAPRSRAGGLPVQPVGIVRVDEGQLGSPGAAWVVDEAVVKAPLKFTEDELAAMEEFFELVPAETADKAEGRAALLDGLGERLRGSYRREFLGFCEVEVLGEELNQMQEHVDAFEATSQPGEAGL